jgi:AraC-like DNA-binding protein
MDWRGLEVRIDWTRCGRRRWPAAPGLAFTPQERRKQRNVLLYWWAGKGQRHLPQGPVAISPGVCHWARPGWSYSCTQQVKNPLGVTAIHFDLVGVDGKVIEPGKAGLPVEQLKVNDPGLVDGVTRWIAERAMNTRSGIPVDAATAQAGEAMLRGLLIELDHATGHTEPGMKPDALAGWRRLTWHIQENLHHLASVDELARKAGYTRSHFSRAFRKQTGLSPQQYIINARVSLAKELLRSTGLTVTQVAMRAGYADLYMFSRQFKQRTGETPSAYRLRAEERLKE